MTRQQRSKGTSENAVDALPSAGAPTSSLKNAVAAPRLLLGRAASLSHRDQSPAYHRDQSPAYRRDQSPAYRRDQSPAYRRDQSPAYRKDQDQLITEISYQLIAEISHQLIAVTLRTQHGESTGTQKCCLQ